MMSGFSKSIILKALPVVAAISLLFPAISFAGFFGDHPSYLKAASHLRHARHLLERPDAPNVAGPEQAAIGQLDAAIGEIKQAARDDWKPADLPSINLHLDFRGRMHEAMKEMEKAQREINREEDDRAARGLRNRATMHLNQAIGLLQQAMSNKYMDGHL
jgi:hypothetical protein